MVKIQMNKKNVKFIYNNEEISNAVERSVNNPRRAERLTETERMND